MEFARIRYDEMISYGMITQFEEKLENVID